VCRACTWTAPTNRFPAVYRRRLWALAIAAAVYGLVSACSESLPEGRACPALCPDQSVQIVDTTIDGLNAMAIDTTIAGYPLLGTEPELLLAADGDSIDVRTIVRFDSVPYEYRPTASDTLQPATQVHFAYLRLTFDTTSFRPQNAAPPVISIYDVDTIGSDTSVAVLASLFRPDRLLGGPTAILLPTSTNGTANVDTIRIPLDSNKVLAHIITDHTIRVGIRLVRSGVAPPAGRVDILNNLSGLPPVFSYEPDTDTTIAAPFSPTVPRSTTPTNDSALAQRLLNYPLIVSGTSPPLGEHLDVGGVPARRIFVQFALPTQIIDSSTVVRATLTLHLIPNTLRGFFGDTMGVLAEGIVSTPAVTDPGHAAGFNAAATVIGIDTSFYIQGQSDSLNVEFVNAARHWHDRATDTVSRAIVLIGTNEGASPVTASFYPALPTVPAALRPHIHLAYVKTIKLPVP
jgi:hypothetical protein